MQYRHEVKHEISFIDMMVLRTRLEAVAIPDSHSIDGVYKIKSLYFDTPKDKALRENLSGVSKRDKFRIRYYNGDKSFIQLEKKSKNAGLGVKESCRLSPEEVRKIIDGDLSWMPGSDKDLIIDLYIRMVFDCLRPKSIVEYTRRPYTFEAGNVRVTMDYDIRTTVNIESFLDEESPGFNVQDNPIILEVKWDNYLPDIIKDCIQLPGRMAEAYSKYTASRAYD